MLGLAWLLLSLALAGPRIPAWIPPSLQAGQSDIVAVVDFSASMRVNDGQPDRIGEARQLLLHWIDRLPPGARLGLVIYAGQAHRILRPTADHGLARHILAQLPQLSPPLLGNNLADALRKATDSFDPKATSRHVLVFSDGDIDPRNRQTAMNALADRSANTAFNVHWIGVGGGEPRTVPRPDGSPLQIDGQRIVSRREGAWLRQVAAHPHGHYYPAETLAHTALTEVLELSPLRIAPENSEQVLWTEYFAVPLIPGIILFLLGLQLPAADRLSDHKALAAVVALLLGGCQWGPDNPDSTTLQALLAAGNFRDARAQAADIPGYRARFAEGVACYRLADYPCASRAFARAAWIATDDLQRGRAVFNLGNTQFRLGDFIQASVLFRDAGLLGVDPAKTHINREYADSLAAAVRQQIADIAESGRRAEWRKAAGRTLDGSDDLPSEGINLPGLRPDSSLLGRISQAKLQHLLKTGVQQLRRLDNSDAQTARLTWVRSAQAGQPQDTAGLFNNLMPLESGLPGRPGKAVLLEGQRAW